MACFDCSELTNRGVLVGCLAESLCTAIFVFLVCASTLGVLNVVVVALTAGLSIATFVLAIGHLTGGLLNPAVAVGLMATRKLDVAKGILFVLSELFGAIIGEALLYGLIPASRRGSLGVTAPAADVSDIQAFGIEAVLTFVLLLAIFAATDAARKHRGFEIPLAIGSAIVICHLVGVPLTGSSLNPARSFGPAIVMNSWKSHWVYWFGPLLGALLAAFLYDRVLTADKNKSQGSPDEEETLFSSPE